MSDRPEWVTCILKEQEGASKQSRLKPPVSFCGRHVRGFAFVSGSHAFTAEAHGSRLQACPECKALAVGDGSWAPYPEESVP